MPISNPFMDFQDRHICNSLCCELKKVAKVRNAYQETKCFLIFSPVLPLPILTPQTYCASCECVEIHRALLKGELFFLFPAYLCNTVGLSKIKEVRRGWDMGVEKYGRKKTLQSKNCSQEKWLKWSLWGTRQWVERQEKFLRTASENLCWKWNPKLNSFPSNKEWRRQFP